MMRAQPLFRVQATVGPLGFGPFIKPFDLSRSVDEPNEPRKLGSSFLSLVVLLQGVSEDVQCNLSISCKFVFADLSDCCDVNSFRGTDPCLYGTWMKHESMGISSFGLCQGSE